MADADIDMSQECNNVLKALLKAQGKFQSIVKTENNPFFHSMYAPLEGVIDAIKQSLLDAEILVFQDVVNESLRTRLIHTTGEWITGYYPFVAERAKTDKKGEVHMEIDSQTIGAAHTYARRYSLMGMFFLGADDDDGETASGRLPQEKAGKPEGREQSAPERAFWKFTDRLGGDKIAHEIIKASTQKESAKDVTTAEFIKINQSLVKITDGIQRAAAKLGPPITFEDIVLYAKGQQGQNLNWNLTLKQLKEKETDPKFASVIIDWLAQNSAGKLV